MKTLLISSAMLGVAALASCADTDDAESAAPTPVAVPEAGGFDLDASADGSPCPNASDGGCTDRELTCAEADFCTVPSGVDSRYALLGIWGTSDKDVWTVGSGGTVLHWDGGGWKKIPIAWKDTLRGVGGSGPDDVWIASSKNVLLRSSGFANGAIFTLAEPIDPDDTTNFTGAVVTKVWASSDGALFVGGPATLKQPQVSLWRHRPGALPAWEPVSTFCAIRPCMGVGGIWGTTADDLWLVGEEGAFRRSKGPIGDGGGVEQWSMQKTTVTDADLHGIWGSSASDVWLVGDRGTIRHFDGDASQTWKVVASPTTKDLRAVWGSGPSDVWAVGDEGTILHFDGASWKSMTATLPVGPRPRLYSVWGSGPRDVWVVGEAVVLHFTGSKSAATEDGR